MRQRHRQDDASRPVRNAHAAIPLRCTACRVSLPRDPASSSLSQVPGPHCALAGHCSSELLCHVLRAQDTPSRTSSSPRCRASLRVHVVKLHSFTRGSVAVRVVSGDPVRVRSRRVCVSLRVVCDEAPCQKQTRMHANARFARSRSVATFLSVTSVKLCQLPKLSYVSYAIKFQSRISIQSRIV